MRPADPYAATPEPMVELLEHPRIVERSSSYLQIVLDARKHADTEAEDVLPVDDELALATGSDS
jgi:hypothetical protein